MAVSNAQKLAKAKYQHEKRALVASEVSKGKRDEYNAAAKGFGLSLSMLVQKGVEEYIKNHGGEEFKPEKPESISAADKRLIEEFNQLPVDARKHFLQAFKAINESKGGGDNDRT